MSTGSICCLLWLKVKINVPVPCYKHTLQCIKAVSLPLLGKTWPIKLIMEVAVIGPELTREYKSTAVTEMCKSSSKLS